MPEYCCLCAHVCRRALLLACCSSLQTAAWVLAVPTLVQQLQQQCFKLGQPCESHGAMWQLLMHHNTTNTNTSSSMAQAAKQTASKGSSDGAEGRDEGLEQQLLSLLRLHGGSSVQLLQRQVVVLQLMVDAQAAAGRGQRLWSDVVRASDDTVGWVVLACWLPSCCRGLCQPLNCFRMKSQSTSVPDGLVFGIIEPASQSVNTATLVAI